MTETRKEIAARERVETEDLPSLVERLFENVANLFDQKLTLLRVEVKEEVEAYVKGVLVIAAGGIIAAVGLALANIALAFAVSTLFADMNLSQPAKYALGFVITGLLYLVLGGIFIVTTKNRLARQGIIPRRTVEELEKDKKWLQKEI